jgi:hypothetical protein
MTVFRLFYVLQKCLHFLARNSLVVVPGVDDDMILDVVVVQIDAAVPHLAF